jgi:hypothetical protein
MRTALRTQPIGSTGLRETAVFGVPGVMVSQYWRYYYGGFCRGCLKGV